MRFLSNSNCINRISLLLEPQYLDILLCSARDRLEVGFRSMCVVKDCNLKRFLGVFLLLGLLLGQWHQ